MTVAEVLITARKKIEKPENWWDGHATDKILSEDYCCMFTALPSKDLVESNLALVALSRIVGSVITFNDTHTHAEVLDAFDKAIAMAQEDNAQ